MDFVGSRPLALQVDSQSILKSRQVGLIVISIFAALNMDFKFEADGVTRHYVTAPWLLRLETEKNKMLLQQSGKLSLFLKVEPISFSIGYRSGPRILRCVLRNLH